MKNLFFIVVGSLIPLLGCESSSSFEKQFLVGTTVSNPLVIGGKQIPLPSGQWIIRGSAVSSTDVGTQRIAMVLINEVRKGRRMGIWISTNLQPAANFGGWGVSRHCGRGDMLHRVTQELVEGGDQECWWINHTQLARSSRTPSEIEQAFDYIKSQGRVAPENSVYVGYRFANSIDYLNVWYLFNPETEELTPSKRAAWRSSDWHVDRIISDPMKVQFVENLKKWGANWLPKVKAGFKGELDVSRPSKTSRN